MDGIAPLLNGTPVARWQMLSVQKKVGLTIGVSAFLVALINSIDLTLMNGQPYLSSLTNPLVYALLFASFIPLLTSFRDSRAGKLVQVMILLGLGLVATAVNQPGDLTGIILVAFALVLGVQYDLLGARFWPRLIAAVILYGIFAIITAGYLFHRPLLSGLNYLIAAAGFLYIFWVVFAEEVRNRRLNEALLHESEARFETVIKNTNIMATNQDRELCYTWVYNPHSCLDTAVAVGKTDDQLFPPDEAARLRTIKQHVLDSGIGVQEEFRCHAGGRERYFDLSVEPLRDDLGRIVGVNTASKDVTERILLRERLIRSERFAATGQLATYIAHEVNSPLQGISSLLDYLRKRYSDEVDLKEGLDLVNDACSAIGRTVKNLLDLNRPIRDRSSRLDLNEIVLSTFALTASMLKQNRVQVDLRLSGGHLPVNGQSQRLTQVFLNLINNAIEALQRRSPTSAPGGRIEVDSSLEYGNAVVHFLDSGPGFSEESLQHLFDPFHTEKALPGMGVGLAICRQIIEGMAGTIGIGNCADGGACVTITIPAAEGGDTDEVKRAGSSSSDNGATSFSKLP